jgi:disulfide bond formation protein DsbB
MYPLVPVLAVAAWRRWFAARWAVFAVAVVGGSISVWHVLIENFPSLETSTSCDPENPCSLVWVRHLGYMTIPTMALSGFALVAALMLTARRPPSD